MKSDMKTTVACLFFGLVLGGNIRAQAPDVPVVREGHGPAPDLIEAAEQLRDAGRLLAMSEVQGQLDRDSCRLTLPPARKRSLPTRELWNRARKAHLRIGYLYLCDKCNNWHLRIAGGYALTADGAVATCFHVVEPADMKEGYLVAATEAGKILPVTEILAGNKFTDACIVRVQSPTPLEPLPLNCNLTPGDPVWCYSDPVDHPGFFSQGIVNRFYQHWHGADAKEQFPRRMNVSTDWAPGSSGAAVLDRFGNAVGHVSTVSAHGEQPQSETSAGATHTGETVIVFHAAVCAADVIALVCK